MSIVQRMKDLTRATLNEMLEKSEDPIRLIDKYLMDQEDKLRELETLYEEALQHTHSLRKQYLQADQLASKRENQAAIALKAGEEELARIALQEKILNEEKREQYRQLYEKGKLTLIELEGQIEEIRSDLQEVIDKRQYYVARLESLQLQRKLDERRSKLDRNHLGSWLNRLEDTITEWEWENTAYREVRGISSSVYRMTEQMEQSLERELAKLKHKLSNKEV